MTSRRLWRVGVALLAGAGLMIGAGAASGVAGAAPVGSVGVFVGYADGLHSSPVDFPSPWAGSANVIFEGCRPIENCAYDAGAVRVVNESGSAVTVNGITVHVDTCRYSGWPAQTLAPHSQLIVTQLRSGTGNGCTGPTPNAMDTSDIGPGGSQYANNCTPDGIVPTVDVTVDGTTTTYSDTGQILNTGGRDLGGCPPKTNESHPWSQLRTTYIALGDSFSSGEGVPPYFNGTDTAANQCHDSTRAYPVTVATTLGDYPNPAGNFGFHACSGAVVADVWGTNGPGVGTIGGIGQWNASSPQISHVESRTGLVTLSIGGNDVGFGTLLRTCISAGISVEVNRVISRVNSKVITPLNTHIARLNRVITLANYLNRFNPFWSDIPTIAAVPPAALVPVSPCLANLAGMLNVLKNGGPETLCKTGNTVTDPVPGTVTCPAGQVTYNVTVPSLTQLYLQIASQAAPNAKIKVMAYPPIVNSAGTTNACSVNVKGNLSASATATVFPFALVPSLSSLPGYLRSRIPGVITRSYNVSHFLDVDVPALTSTALANLNTAAAQLNGVIASSVASAAGTDPNITLVNPYSQFAPPVNGGLGGWFCNDTATTNILGGPTTVKPFFNQGLMKPSTLTITSVNLGTPTVNFAFGGADPGTVHPNAKGQKAQACAFLGRTVTQCGL